MSEVNVKITWNGEAPTMVRTAMNVPKTEVKPGQTIEVTEEVANYLERYSKNWSTDGKAKAEKPAKAEEKKKEPAKKVEEKDTKKKKK